jgi:hypothetical protein
VLVVPTRASKEAVFDLAQRTDGLIRCEVG